jgi:hypothetical protein
MNEKHQQFVFKLICRALCVDNPNLNDEVSRFSLERSPLLSLAENDMIDENLNVTRLQSNMSAPHVNPESRRCVLVAFTCLHVCTLMSVVHIRKTYTNIY